MIARKLKEFLDSNQVKYVTIRHSPAYTMSEIAHAAHICGKRVAKTVMVKLDDRMAMAVVPSSCKVDLAQLEELTGARSVALADEGEFKKLFAGCEPGAMPPFGNLYGMDVFVAPELADQGQVVFNAGTHTELVQMEFADFERLVKPRIPTVTFTE